MDPKSPKFLEDIRDAADFIEQVTRAKSLADYRTDRLVRQAVERNFQIIGEALSKLAKTDPSTAARISRYPRIISFRNLLIHGYDVIDESKDWEIIEQHLPGLLAEVTAWLADEQ
jgi:uncharacterized protein with HEPN domain